MKNILNAITFTIAAIFTLTVSSPQSIASPNDWPLKLFQSKHSCISEGAIYPEGKILDIIKNQVSTELTCTIKANGYMHWKENKMKGVKTNKLKKPPIKNPN